MTMVDSLAISMPLLLSVIGAIIAYENYKLNKKKADKADSVDTANKIKADDEREKANELKLIAIEKDVQYIRMMVDKFDSKVEDHERRIIKLESKKERK